jgi:hypothetical protein
MPACHYTAQCNEYFYACFFPVGESKQLTFARLPCDKLLSENTAEAIHWNSNLWKRLDRTQDQKGLLLLGRQRLGGSQFKVSPGNKFKRPHHNQWLGVVVCGPGCPKA